MKYPSNGSYQITTLKHYCDQHASISRKVILPHGRYHWPKRQFSSETFQEMWIGEFENVFVNHIFHLFDAQNRLAVIDESYQFALDYFPMPHTIRGSCIEIPWNCNFEVIEDPVFILGGHDNHYHWFLNWLPRMIVLEAVRVEFMLPDNFRVVVHDDISKVQLESLEVLGISSERLIKVSNKHSNESVRYLFKRALYCSFFPSVDYNRSVREFYQNRFPTPELVPTRRIYVSRQGVGSPRRRIHNHEEIEPILGEFGFETIESQNLSLVDQIAIYRSAQAIFGPHGAGLANFIFAPDSTFAYVLDRKPTSEYTELARVMNLKPRRINGNDYIDSQFEESNPKFQPRLRDFIVEPKALRDMFHADLSIC